MRKQQLSLSEKEELDLLSEQLDPREMYVIGFMKGFDRKALKEWNKKGLMDFSVI